MRCCWCLLWRLDVSSFCCVICVWFCDMRDPVSYSVSVSLSRSVCCSYGLAALIYSQNTHLSVGHTHSIMHPYTLMLVLGPPPPPLPCSYLCTLTHHFSLSSLAPFPALFLRHTFRRRRLLFLPNTTPPSPSPSPRLVAMQSESCVALRIARPCTAAFYRPG